LNYLNNLKEEKEAKSKEFSNSEKNQVLINLFKGDVH